jgi:hypothetical protein
LNDLFFARSQMGFDAYLVQMCFALIVITVIGLRYFAHVTPDAFRLNGRSRLDSNSADEIIHRLRRFNELQLKSDTGS